MAHLVSIGDAVLLVSDIRSLIADVILIAGTSIHAAYVHNATHITQWLHWEVASFLERIPSTTVHVEHASMYKLC